MNLLEILKYLSQGKMPPPGGLPQWLLNLISIEGSLRGRIGKLTAVERVLTAVSHREPDRVPVTPMVAAAGRQINGIGFPEFSLDPASTAEVFLAGSRMLGGEFIILLQDLSVEAADFGQKVLYPENSTAHPDYDDPLIKDADDYRKIKPVPFAGSKRMKNFVEAASIIVKRSGFSVLPIGFVFGPLGVLSMMRGAERLFKDCVTNKKDVMAACGAITETLIEYSVAQCDAGVPGIAIDTLFASYQGLPKKLWEEIEGPFAGEIASAILKQGVLVGIHNCGHGPYFDAQIRAMEPSFISFAQLPDDCATGQEMKKRYGGHVTLVGHIPTQTLHGPTHKVIEECRRQIDLYADGGGFVLAPGCEYPPNLSLMNAYAVVKAAQMYG